MQHPSAAQDRPMDTAMPAPPTAATPVPDSRGLNLFRADPYAAALSRLYLPAALHAHLLPHLDRLARWPAAAWTSWPPTPTGTRPRCRCATAPGPTNPASTSTRPTSSWSAWPTAIRPGRAVASRRRAGLARAHAGSGQVRAQPSVRAGRVRPVLPGQHDRFAGAHAAQVRRAGTRRQGAAAGHEPGLRQPAPGRHVHDRAGRGLRCQRHRGRGRGAAGRQLAS